MLSMSMCLLNHKSLIVHNYYGIPLRENLWSALPRWPKEINCNFVSSSLCIADAMRSELCYSVFTIPMGSIGVVTLCISVFSTFTQYCSYAYLVYSRYGKRHRQVKKCEGDLPKGWRGIAFNRNKCRGLGKAHCQKTNCSGYWSL